MSEKQPLQMTGEEIERTFGAKDVLELEGKRDQMLGEIEELRAQISERWDDDDFVSESQLNVQVLIEKLQTLQRDLRARRNKYGQTLDSTSPLTPM